MKKNVRRSADQQNTSISLSVELLLKAKKRAAESDRKFSEYIRWLIKHDLERN